MFIRKLKKYLVTLTFGCKQTLSNSFFIKKPRDRLSRICLTSEFKKSWKEAEVTSKVLLDKKDSMSGRTEMFLIVHGTYFYFLTD